MRGIATKLLSATVLTGAGAGALAVPLTLFEAAPDSPIGVSAPREERTAVVRIQAPSAPTRAPTTTRRAAGTVTSVAPRAQPQARLVRRVVAPPAAATPKPSQNPETADAPPSPQPAAAPAAPAPPPPPPTQVARVAAAVKTDGAAAPAAPKPGRRLGHLKRAAQLAPARSAAAILGRHPSGKPKTTSDAKPKHEAKPTPTAKPKDEQRGGSAAPPPAPPAPQVAPPPPEPQQQSSANAADERDQGNGGDRGRPSSNGDGAPGSGNAGGNGNGDGNGKEP